MATTRKIAFVEGEIYHIFNRAIDRKPIFINKRLYERAKQLIKFYKHQEIPIRYSQVIHQPQEIRESILNNLYKSARLVDILAYCLMPNHFHFLIKQTSPRGISTFISNFTNAYTRYFNTKNERVGPIFEGIFKAVLIESEEQLIHVSRYIHLNPIASSIIDEKNLDNYSWSSYREYLSLSNDSIVEKSLILGMFKSTEAYRQFVTDQIDYAKKLDEIKHLVME